MTITHLYPAGCNSTFPASTDYSSVDHKIWSQGQSGHQTVSDYTTRQWFSNSQQSWFLTACRRLEKLVLPSIFDASLSSLMTWNLQSYQTTVLNERTWYFRGSNILWPLLDIFRGSTPPTLMIFAPVSTDADNMYTIRYKQHEETCMFITPLVLHGLHDTVSPVNRSLSLLLINPNNEQRVLCPDAANWNDISERTDRQYGSGSSWNWHTGLLTVQRRGRRHSQRVVKCWCC